MVPKLTRKLGRKLSYDHSADMNSLITLRKIKQFKDSIQMINNNDGNNSENTFP